MPKRDAVAFEAKSGAELRKAGGYRFLELHGGERVGLEHSCPCGCGELGALWFKGKAPKRDGKPAHAEWEVAGDWPMVWLTPSIGFKKGDEDGTTKPYHWHGHLLAGVFKEM